MNIFGDDRKNTKGTGNAIAHGEEKSRKKWKPKEIVVYVGVFSMSA